jgi:gas vesicle protein
MEDDDLFVEGIGAIIGAATATFSAVASGKAKGVSPKVFEEK